MRRADHVIDLGPGAGRNGGEILATGTVAKLLKSRRSLTGKYLRKGLKHPSRGSWRPLPEDFNARKPSSREEWLVLREASLRNLKGQDVHFPKQRLIMVCGISGAGKSTLVRDLLMPAVREAISSGQSNLRGSPARDGFQSLPVFPHGHRGGPVADRQDPALDAGHLHRGLRPDPEVLCQHPGGTASRPQRRDLLLQHQGRPL